MSRFHASAVLFIIQVIFTPQVATAASTQNQEEMWVHHNQQSGLIGSLPYSQTSTIIKQMNDTKTALQTHKVELTQLAQKREFDTQDGLITLAMPGGLIYAVIVKARHKSIVKQLNKVTAQLDNLNSDLIEFRSAGVEPVMVALLQ